MTETGPSPRVGDGSPLAQIEGLAAGHYPLCPVVDGGRECKCEALYEAEGEAMWDAQSY